MEAYVADITQIKPIEAIVLFDNQECYLVSLLTLGVISPQDLPLIAENTNAYITAGEGVDNSEQLHVGRALVRFMAAMWEFRQVQLTDIDLIGLTQRQREEILLAWGATQRRWQDEGRLEFYETSISCTL